MITDGNAKFLILHETPGLSVLSWELNGPKSIKYLSVLDVEKSMNMKLTEDDINRSLSKDNYSLIFYEDWYFDYSDFSFSKKVKGLGIAKDESEDYPKTTKPRILFFILFDQA